MRLNIRMVGNDSKTIIVALKQLIEDEELLCPAGNGNIVIPCGDNTVDVDYEFTDSDDVFEDDSDAKVINPD